MKSGAVKSSNPVKSSNNGMVADYTGLYRNTTPPRVESGLRFDKDGYSRNKQIYKDTICAYGRFIRGLVFGGEAVRSSTNMSPQ